MVGDLRRSAKGILDPFSATRLAASSTVWVDLLPDEW